MISNQGPSDFSVTSRKDVTLDWLATRFNVAQFVSFAPSSDGPSQTYSRVVGYEANHVFASLDQIIEILLHSSGENALNVRSFTPEDPQSREFIYGLRNAAEIKAALLRLSSGGLFTILNETIDVSDGGVSGVAMGDLVEFAPDATPRAVEEAGFASMSLRWAESVLSAVYGFDPKLMPSHDGRLEFSIHPKRRGWRQEHITYWEYGPLAAVSHSPAPSWPNDFSRMIGDKAFGLLVAHIIGLPVPSTTVIGRRVAPFTFGTDTGSYERWIRTSPNEQAPGKFTTAYGWTDPFRLLQMEDPTNSVVSSVLSQQAVPAQWSGASLEGQQGQIISEGVKGSGDQFMLGNMTQQPIPTTVDRAISAAHARLNAVLGPTRFEWAFDGTRLWILQLHRGASASEGSVIVPGDAERWIEFEVSQGLEALRNCVSSMTENSGLVLVGEVGLTSHIADVARKAGLPTRIRNQQPSNTSSSE